MEGRAAPSLAAQAIEATRVYGSGDAAVRALDSLSLELASGAFTAVMGRSGSGKSTLMHCMAGLDRLTSGTIILGGQDLSALGDRALTALRREKVGFIFQAFNLLPTMSVAENITLPMAIAGAKPDRDWVDHVVETLGLQDRLSYYPSQLSGGQQQRVAAARALATRPEIVFADEPTGNLDSRSSAELLDLLATASEETGQTIMMVTHDPAAASYASRAVFLADGQVVDELAGPTAEAVLDCMKRLGS
jgi:putative ABC transport system ATP-binding protein